MGKSQAILVVSAVVLSIGLATPASGAPVLSSIDLYPYGAFGANNVVYWKGVVFLTAEGLHVLAVNVQDPTNLTYLGNDGMDPTIRACDLTVADDMLYVAHWYDGVRVFRILPPGVLGFQWVYDCGGACYWGVDVYRQRVYATGPGTQILDVSDPTDPIETSRFDTLTTGMCFLGN